MRNRKATEYFMTNNEKRCSGLGLDEGLLLELSVHVVISITLGGILWLQEMLFSAGQSK